MSFDLVFWDSEIPWSEEQTREQNVYTKEDFRSTNSKLIEFKKNVKRKFRGDYVADLVPTRAEIAFSGE